MFPKRRNRLHGFAALVDAFGDRDGAPLSRAGWFGVRPGCLAASMSGAGSVGSKFAPFDRRTDLFAQLRCSRDSDRLRRPELASCVLVFAPLQPRQAFLG